MAGEKGPGVDPGSYPVFKLFVWSVLDFRRFDSQGSGVFDLDPPGSKGELAKCWFQPSFTFGKVSVAPRVVRGKDARTPRIHNTGL
jgi:hypothetical protein